jgi:hypothetical protein
MECFTIMGQILAISGVYMIYQVLTACFFQRIALLNPLREPIEGSERGYGFCHGKLTLVLSLTTSNAFTILTTSMPSSLRMDGCGG